MKGSSTIYDMCEFFKEGRLIGMGGSILNCQGIHVSDKLIQFFDVFFGQADDSDTYLLIADEPTTALDVTIQAQIMDLLVELKDKINTAIILITHDLGVVAGIADRVAVMYAGKVVETGTTAQIFYEHKHPYTEALLRSLPSADAGKREPLMSIPGTPPDLLCPPKG